MLPTFEQVIAEVPDGQAKSVLLGNGFSRACRDDVFDYSTLLDHAEFGEQDPSVHRLFEALETYDFERVMRVIESTMLVLNAFEADAALQQELINIGKSLKDALINAIGTTHPDRPYEISDEEYVATRHFLAMFDEIFSVNYDLLMCWARNKDNLAPVRFDSDDGFRTRQTWEGLGRGSGQNVHFLHGALHLYEDEAGIRKHAYFQDGPTIVDQVRSNLERGRFPIFVSEPTAEKKLKRIAGHPYLNFCFNALGQLNGSLFVVGHAFGEHDRHLFDQVLLSGNVTRVYVSLHGDERSRANQQTRANARTYLDVLGPNGVVFFDAASLPIWSNGESREPTRG